MGRVSIRAWSLHSLHFSQRSAAMADMAALTALCSVILFSHSAAMPSKNSGRMPCHCNHLRHFATIPARNAGLPTFLTTICCNGGYGRIDGVMLGHSFQP
jgi:hypothetical protein